MVTDKYLSIRDIVSLLGVHEHTVENWLRSGNLRGYKFGKLWRIKMSDLESFRAEYTTGGQE